MRTAVLTVMYPEMADFMEEYIRCIQNQTVKDFELVVISDRFPIRIEPCMKRVGIKAKVFKFSQSPLRNRLYGLKVCSDLGYDIVICSDSDETMFADRIEKIVTFFSKHPEKKIAYNNAVAQMENGYFDLFYKERITLPDVLEFNVLGYGALNLRRDMIPFVLNHRNEQVIVFDWWLAVVYLLKYREVDFLKDVKNNYKTHSGNFVGPVLDINKERIKLGIQVKKIHYTELARYCLENGFEDKVDIFINLLDKVTEIEKFIAETSLDNYVELLKNHFQNKEKIYWWEDIASLDKCGSLNYERSSYW